MINNLLNDLIKEQGVEVYADNVRIRLNPTQDEQTNYPRRRRRRRDPIRTIGEGTLALAVPFGVLSYLI